VDSRGRGVSLWKEGFSSPPPCGEKTVAPWDFAPCFHNKIPYCFYFLKTLVYVLREKNIPAGFIFF
jgi:hypothetical protein